MQIVLVGFCRFLEEVCAVFYSDGTSVICSSINEIANLLSSCKLVSWKISKFHYTVRNEKQNGEIIH